MLQMISSFHALLAGAFPLVLLLTGAILHTFGPHYRLILEERVKHRVMTATAARRSAQFVRWSAPTMTFLGVVLTSLLLCEFFL